MKVFKTLRAAAIAGCAEANPLTKQTGNEWGGLILKVSRGFTYSKPGTSGMEGSINPVDIIGPIVPDYPKLREDGDAVGVRRVLRAAGVVAFYHIHPCSDGTDRTAKYFSQGDMGSMVISGFKNAYMAVNCTGSVYEIDGDTEIIYPQADDFFHENPAGLGALVGTV